MLVDSFVRRLVDRHFHIARKFGSHFATVFEFTSGIQENVKAKKDAIRHEWRYPKEVFDWYKSAELHTVKRRIPARVYLLGVLPFVFGGLTWLAWSRLNPEAQVQRAESSVVAAGGTASAPAGQARPAAAAGQASISPTSTLSPTQYLETYAPRIPDLPHTAAAYDHLTKPTAVPVPAMCIDSAKRCQCYTQQATRLEMAAELCKRIARDGFFQEFDPQPERQARGGAGELEPSEPQQVRRLPAQIVSDPKEVHAQRVAAAQVQPAQASGFQPLPEAVQRGLAGRVNQALQQRGPGAGAAPQ